MTTTNYYNTLIEVSADCPARSGKVPGRAGTVALLQYRFLSERPYAFTSDELLVAVAAERQGRDADEWAEVKAELFSRPQACLRGSPLVKSFGWGLHHNDKGRVALVDSAGPEYWRLMADEGTAKMPGMRSRRG